jgi:hypothetical protein
VHVVGPITLIHYDARHVLFRVCFENKNEGELFVSSFQDLSRRELIGRHVEE